MRLLGAGDNVVDRYRDLGLMYPGGNALNVAVAAARGGAAAAYVGAVGTDRAGDVVLAGLRAEGIDVSLDTSSVLDQSPGMARQAGSGKYYDYPYWWWRWYSRTEMRDDKVVLFADHLPAGTYQYTYTFRAYVPGEYQVIPTVASEMYFPEVFGRADGRLFTIR